MPAVSTLRWCLGILLPSSAPRALLGALIGAFLLGGAIVSVGHAAPARIVAKSIGTNHRDFSSPLAWHSARAGNLVTRQVWSVDGGTGRFTRGEVVTGTGCAGVYVPEDEAGTNGAVMSVDGVSGACAPGTVLVGQASAASAVFSAVVSATGTIERGELYNDAVFSARVVLSGSTVDAAHYLWLTAAAGQEHNGRPGTGTRLVVQDNWAPTLTISTPYTVVEKLEIVNLGAAGSPTALYNTAPTGTRYDRLIVQSVGGIAVYFPAAVTSNILVHGSRVGVFASYANQRSIYNTTIVNSTTYGVQNQVGVGPRLVNVVVMGSGTADFLSSQGWAPGSGFNAGPSTSTPPGPQSITTLRTVDFADYAGKDFRPSPTSVLKDAGADVSSVFTTDLGGEPRTTLWDIGAYEAPSGPDLTAPIRSAGAPTGTLAAGTTSTVLSLATNEPATCRYGSAPDTTFDALVSAFATTGGTSHSTPLGGLAGGSAYTFYVRCRDVAGNTNPDDYAIAFSVATVATDTTPPVRSASAPAGILPAGTASTVLSLTTNEPATCRYGPAPNTLFPALPTPFATTGGTSHTSPLGGLSDGQALTLYVRCQDNAGNSNPDDFVIAFSVAASGAIPVVVKSIGTSQRDFTTLQAWEIARGGNLVTRQVWSVVGGAGRFAAGEIVAGSGCFGVYVPEDEALTNGSVMTVDNVSGSCASGATLLGQTSGASAVFTSAAVTGGTIERAEMYKDSVFTRPVIIGGAIVDPAHYLWITAAPGHEHSGTPGTGVQLVMTPHYSRIITVSTPYTVIEKLELVNLGISGIGLYTTSPVGTRYDRLIVRVPLGWAVYIPAAITSNLLVYDSQVGIYASYSQAASVLSTTIVRSTSTAVLNQSGIGPRLVNVVAFSTTGAIFSSPSGWAAGSGSNAGPAASTPPGPGSLTNVTADAFTSYAGSDFRPAAVSVLRNVGTNLAALFTRDLAGAQRNDRWDVGAYDAPGAPDLTFPVRSGGSPTGLLMPGTTSATLSLVTDRAATCKYGPGPGVAWASLPTTFATTGGTTHSQRVSGFAGGTFSAYVRCKDTTGAANDDDYLITFGVGSATIDATAPTRSSGAPSGSLPAGTTSALLALLTNEAATCRYGSAPGTPFAAMPATFTTTGGVAHATTLSGLVDNGSYTAYIRCRDAGGNTDVDDYVVTFSVAGAPPDITPPVRSSGAPSGLFPPGTTSATLSLATDEPATCRYGPDPGTPFASLSGTFATTDGLAHATSIGGLSDGGVYVAYVRCRDAAGNANPSDYVIAFTVGPTVFETLPDNTWMRLTTVPTERYTCVLFVDCTNKAILSHPVGRHWTGTEYGDGKIFYFGGGHQGHPGNDVEIFDIASHTWIQQYQPEGLPTICLTDVTADPACAIMFGGAGGPNPTPLGRPTVQHLFQKAAWDPVHRMFIAGLATGTWGFSADTHAWTRLTTVLPPSPNDPRMLMVYDPDVQRMLWFALTSPDGNAIHAFDFPTATWSRYDSFPTELRASHVYAAYDTHNRRHLLAQSIADDLPMTFWLYDAPAKRWTQITNAPAALNWVHSVDYDQVNRVFLFLQPKIDGTVQLWTYDELGTWQAVNPSGPAPTGSYGLFDLWNVMKYDPITQVFFFVDVKRTNDGGTDRTDEGSVETWIYRYRK